MNKNLKMFCFLLGFGVIATLTYQKLTEQVQYPPYRSKYMRYQDTSIYIATNVPCEDKLIDITMPDFYNERGQASWACPQGNAKLNR